MLSVHLCLDDDLCLDDVELFSDSFISDFEAFLFEDSSLLADLCFEDDDLCSDKLFFSVFDDFSVDEPDEAFSEFLCFVTVCDS